VKELVRSRAVIGIGALVAVLAIAGGAYVLGHSSGADVDAAKASGSAEGRAQGAAQGAQEGLSEGKRKGRKDALSSSFEESYVAAYKKAYEDAGLDVPKEADVDVPDPPK
jgi:hypothetical protein